MGAMGIRPSLPFLAVLALAVGLGLAGPVLATDYTNQRFEWQSSQSSRSAGTYGEYVFSIVPSIYYTAETKDIVPGTSSDTYLYLLNSARSVINQNDDAPGLGLASRIKFRPTYSGLHYVRLRAFAQGTYGYCTLTITANRVPVWAASLGTSVTHNSGYDVVFTVTASDPDGDALSAVSAYKLVGGAEQALPAGVTFSGGTFRMTGAANTWPAGSVSDFRFKVTETHDGSNTRTTSLDVRVTILENRPPAIETTPESPIVHAEVGTFDMSVGFYDPENDPLPLETKLAVYVNPDGTESPLPDGLYWYFGWLFLLDPHIADWPKPVTDHTIRIKVSETLAGRPPRVTTRDIPIRVELPTRVDTVTHTLGTETHTHVVTSLAEDGLPYAEVVDEANGISYVQRKADGTLEDTLKKIDVVIFAYLFETHPEISVDFPSYALDAAKKITSLRPFDDRTQFNFWRLNTIAIEGPSPLYDVCFAPLARALVGRVDTSARIGNAPAEVAFSVEGNRFIYLSVTFAGTSVNAVLHAAAHEFGHSYGFDHTTPEDYVSRYHLGDEAVWSNATLTWSANGSPRTLTLASRLKARIRLRGWQNQFGTCSFKISPPPEGNLYYRRDAQSGTVLPAVSTDALTWNGVQYGWNTSYAASWAPGETGMANGEYQEIYGATLLGNVAYTFEVLSYQGQNPPAFLVLGEHSVWVDDPDPDRYVNVNATKRHPTDPLFPWRDRFGYDPERPGVYVGAYEGSSYYAFTGVFRPTLQHCQLNALAPPDTPFCRICRERLILNMDITRFPELRDDLGAGRQFPPR